MRILALLAVATAVLSLPVVASADPAAAVTTAPGVQTATAPPMTVQPAPAPATSAQPAPAAPAQTASTSSGVNLDEIVCRNSAPATGTRLGGGRECHSVREWNQRERRDQEILEKAQQAGFHSGN